MPIFVCGGAGPKLCFGKSGEVCAALRICALIGLTDPAQPIADAVSAAGADAIDLDTIPLLAAPLWAMSPKERIQIGQRIPFLPSG